MDRKQKIEQLARAVEAAGGTRAYVQQQMQVQGFVVERKDTDKMSKRELQKYKNALKQEATNKKQLAKQAWQGFMQNNIIHLGDDIYWHDTDDHDKFDIDERVQRLQENELPSFNNVTEFAKWLGLTVSQLRGLTYHRECATKIHYRRFTIAKRDGGERAIWAPEYHLKRAQRQVLNGIVSRLLVHDASHGFMLGRSIFTNAMRHTEARVVVKMDLKDFFPTITFKRVKGLFRKAGYQEQIATLLALLCTEAPREVIERDGKTYFIAMDKRCLPQGAPTSPAISNALCLRLDRRLQGLAKSLDYRYTRYADDLTFSQLIDSKAKPNLGALCKAVAQITKEEGFVLHPNKTRVTRAHRRQQVTGLVVNGKGQPRVTRQLKRQLRAAIHNLKQGKPLPEGESIARLQGYASFIAMSEPEFGRKLLEELKAFMSCELQARATAQK